ncbi:MAG TPA: N-acetylmuramoyl-L-alanine amidase [Stenomitos sp.]
MPRPARFRLVGLALAFLLSGCATTMRAMPAADEGPRQPEAALLPHEAKVYSALVDALPDPTPQPLKGRVIVVDPGHGGKETGTVGPAGTKEKDVNLAVAKQLAALLRQAGARVVMTREGDTGVAPEGSPLSEDLKARAEIANRLPADLFVSVHHNATLDSLKNLETTETYYKMDDAGPSVDLGAALHRSLVRNLQLPNERLMPGNYAVLRNARVPAVLGEASYLSHPPTEQKLRQPAKQLLEAQAYYLGILDYFAKGTPRITAFEPAAGSDPARPTWTAEFSGGPIDPAAIDLMLDGKRVRGYFDPEDQSLIFQADGPLSNATHSLSLQARNLGGNSTERAERSFAIARPAATLRPDLPLSALPEDGPWPVAMRVLDAKGMPVADGTEVRWTVAGAKLAHPSTRTRDGLTVNYLTDAAPQAHLEATAGTAKLQIKAPTQHRAVLSGSVQGPDDQGLGGVTIVAMGRTESRMTQSNADGYWWFDKAPEGLQELRVVKPGIRIQAFSLTKPQYVPIRVPTFTNPQLRTQTVFLNPEGGSEDKDPTRRKLAGYNWMVADYLRGYLEAAGAQAPLTRGRDESPSDVQRVRDANLRGATLFLTIGHTLTGALQTSHYPTSANGKRIAGDIRTALAGVLQATGSTVADSTYTLIQTTCPSVTVVPGPAPIGDASARARREAYGIFLGLSAPPPQAASLTVHLVKQGVPLANGGTTLDLQWAGQTDAGGSWQYAHLEPGEHYLTVSDGVKTRSFWITRLEAGEARHLTLDLDRPELPENLAKKQAIKLQ